MKTSLITLENHPSWIAVIDGRRDFNAAARLACEALCNPLQYCAVIIRNKENLTETHARAAASCQHGSRSYITLDERQYQRNLPFGKIGPTFTKDAFSQEVGSDYQDLLNAFTRLFPLRSAIELRCTDYRNHNLHIDSATPESNSNREKKFPGRITATMSVRGGGTITVEAGKDDFIRRSSEWILPEDHSLSFKKRWQTADGDVYLGRSADWPETHIPCPHKSPNRKRPDDPNERIVGVLMLA